MPGTIHSRQVVACGANKTHAVPVQGHPSLFQRLLDLGALKTHHQAPRFEVRHTPVQGLGQTGKGPRRNLSVRVSPSTSSRTRN